MRTQIIGNAGAPAFLNPLPQALALLNGMGFMGKVCARDGRDRDDDHHRPQAELKPAAFAFWRVGGGRLVLHGRIIPGRRRPEQEIQAGSRYGIAAESPSIP